MTEPAERHLLAYQAIEAHFGADRIADLIGARREFGSHLKPDIDRTLRALLEPYEPVMLGLHQEYAQYSLALSRLLSRTDREEVQLTPLEYQEIDVGDDEPFLVARAALWLFRVDGAPVAVTLSDLFEGEHRYAMVEVIHGPERASFKADFFAKLADATARADLYRGKVLSLQPYGESTGLRSDILVHRFEPVTREEVILAEATRRQIDTHVFSFDAHRTALSRLGQSTRKGILLYGPPGTGKTHTIRYITSNLPGRTTILIAGEPMYNLRRYMGLAKSLAPSIVVLEDVDLIGRSREQNGLEGVLNELLNEMDGLSASAEVLFILTTNRPEAIEPALANRPGRVDATIEVPLPDLDCRRRLIELYGARMAIGPDVLEVAAQRTEGASAAYMKEFVRRLAQASLERGADGAPNVADVDAIVSDTIDKASGLGRRAIGFAIGKS